MLDLLFTIIVLMFLIGLSCGVWVIYNFAKLGVMQLQQEMDEIKNRNK